VREQLQEDIEGRDDKIKDLMGKLERLEQENEELQNIVNEAEEGLRLKDEHGLLLIKVEDT